MPSHTWTTNEEHVFAYIAGIMDGDGSIYGVFKTKPKISLYAKLGVGICIGMTDKPVIDFIKTMYPDGGVYPVKGTNRPYWQYKLAGAFQIKGFLAPLMPYLIAKKECANLALRIIDTFQPRGVAQGVPIDIGERRLAIWRELRGATHFNAGNRTREVA